jgi:hypothetical protein
MAQIIQSFLNKTKSRISLWDKKQGERSKVIKLGSNERNHEDRYVANKVQK